MKKTIVILAATAISAAAGAQAQSVGETRLSFGASTLGVTAEVQHRVHSNFSIRGVFGGGLSFDQTIDFDGSDYDAEFKPGGGGVMVDFHPDPNLGLRVSAGAMYTNPTVEGNTTASATNPIQVGNFTLNSGEVVTASVEAVNTFAPMVSVGWDQPIGSGNWVLSAEAGAMLNGGYQADVTVTGGILPPGDIALETDRIQDELDRLKVYPYVSLMMGIKF